MRSELRKSIDATFYNGLFDIIIKSLTTGPLLAAYALSLGIGNIMLGFLQSISSFSNLVHLVVSYFLEKGISAKRIACISSCLSRPLLALMALSFFLNDHAYRYWIFILSYVLFYIMGAVTGGVFWPWCKAFVPKSLTTSFFTQRIRYILLIKVITVTVITIFLSFINTGGASDISPIYSLLLLLAFIIGLFYTYTLFQMQEVKLQNRAEMSFWEKISFVLKKKDFRIFFLNIGFANFALSFFMPFSIVFLLKDLMLSVPISLFFSVGSSCIDILFMGYWKKYVQHKNLVRMLSRATLFFVPAIGCLVYLSLYKSNIYPILVMSFILIGIGNSGVNLAISDTSFSYVPAKMSSVYISIVNIGRFCFSGMGSLLAGISIEIFGYHTPYKWAAFFALSAVFFILSGICVKKIEPIE